MEEDSHNDFYCNILDQSDRNESDFLSSSWDEEYNSNEDEEKNKILIQKILDDRKNSIKKIENFFLYWKKINSARKQLVNILLEKRKENSIIIQRCFRYYLKRKLLQEIILKEELNFSILCSIKYVKQIDLKVYLPDDQCKIFHFDFCKLRNFFVLYIPRKLCKNRVFKVNFIADGKIVIDPRYKADYDLSNTGMFYNIIDFNKIENFEKSQKEDKKRILEYHREKYKKKNEMFEKFKKDFFYSSSDSDVDENFESQEKSSRNKKKNSDLRLKVSSSANFSQNNAPHSAFQLAKVSFCKNQRNSFCFSSPLKSILRSPTSSRISSAPKRVSFCEALVRNVNVK